ncbi:MAG: DUF4199 domain-containing protein [Bacteroidota bacterium]
MEKPSLFKASLNYGLILGAVAIVYSLLLYILGQIGNQNMGYLSFVFYIVVMILGIKNYREKFSDGFISYGNSFLIGLFIVLIGGIISSLFTFILFKFIDPGLVESMLEQVRQKMEAKGGLTEEQIDMAMKYTQTMMSPLWMFIWGLVASAFIGTILSLIVSIFMKKEGTPFDMPNTPQP